MTAVNIIEENLKLLPEAVKTKFLGHILKDPVRDSVSEAFSHIKREKIDKPVIYIGAGTCGLAAGAHESHEKIKAYLENKKIDAQIIEVGCIGFCAMEPLIDIQVPGKPRLSFKWATSDKIEGMLDSAFANSPKAEDVLGQFKAENVTNWNNIPMFNDHPFFAMQTKQVLQNCGIISPVSINEYIANGGYIALLKTIFTQTPEQVCDTVEKSGLRGRGGGGFPTGKKWKMALAAKGAHQKYIVCNADEGDPGAFMDRAVIEGDPHRILEGIAIGAYAIGASKAYVYIRAEYPLAIANLKTAIKDATKYGLLGENIYGSGFSLEVIIKTGAGAFVCGEETALMHSIEGKRGMPRPRPPYPAEKGLFGKPTILNNVETFGNIPEIIARGADWFASVGTKNSKGTKVFAVSGKVKYAGLVEVPMGVSVRDIVFKIAGGCANDRKFKAVQIGGPSGGCISDENLDIEVDYETLKTVGAMMGSGGLVVMDDGNCMVDVAKFFMDFIQRESCGKCTPCREGTYRLLEMLQAITGDIKLPKPVDIEEMQKLGRVINSTSLCGLGQTAPNPVMSTMKWFAHEYHEHIVDGKCAAGVCKGLLGYTIEAAKCVGCTACARACPVNAIEGKVREPHKIIQEKCIKCGNCFKACKFDAVKVG